MTSWQHCPQSAKRRAQINDRAMELATIKDVLKTAEQTQKDLALSLGVGLDTISR
jgi:hypothetical protein